MDDGIELNFAAPSSSEPVRRHVAVKKGGRWTDRVKAKREARDAVRHSVAARPEVAPTPATAPSQPVQRTREVPPPPARSRNPETGIAAPAPRVLAPARPTQVISKPSVARAVSHSSPVSTRNGISSPSKATARPPVPAARAEQSPTAGPSRPSHIPIPQPTASKAKAPQIISSLFTSGPSVSKPIPTRLAERPAGAPSNAPLGDTSTFAGLGLHPLLDRHLKSKMGVSAPTAIQRSCLPYLLSSPLDLSSPDDEDDDYETMTDAVSSPNGKGKEPMRDVFIQSQTGSGKTLSYLLPIIQTLLPLSHLSYIDRSIGTLAIILAPTRELAQQISKVLEALLTMSLASSDQEDDTHYTRWLVSGLLTGGSTKNHEKTRLRKGVPILVATPGRLLDHLQNTSSFKCAKTMFLVLDEADRLMDLGFEETITGIVKALDGRRKIEMAAEDEVEGGVMKWDYWSRGRRNILCSATIDAKVEKLAGVMLKDPVVFRGQTDTAKKPNKEDAMLQEALGEGNKVVLPDMAEDKFTPPSQLSQKYVVVPTKLRLVTLVALLRSLVGKAGRNGEEGTKVIVFLSSTDTVDFHWKLLGGVNMGDDAAEPEAASASGEDDGGESADEDGGNGSTPNDAHSQARKSPAKKKPAAEVVALSSPLLPNTTIHRLHGSLPLRTRLASLASFAGASAHPSILLATSVASRGLDLPLVRAVVQYDLPTEGGANEYVHRVGRTARAGKGGEAWAFVGPSEAEWVPWVEGKMGAASGASSGGAGDVRLGQVGVEDVLKRGFGGKGFEYEARATEAQLALERWVLADEPSASLARKAFASFVRAYSTHPAEEKRFFHPKSLHLGHLAKAFALREAPSSLAASSGRGAAIGAAKTTTKGKKRKREEGAEDEEETGETGRKSRTEEMARNETERRMYEAVRKAGRMSKAKGVMGQFDTARSNAAGGEFHVMGAGELERMVKRR